MKNRILTLTFTALVAAAALTAPAFAEPPHNDRHMERHGHHAQHHAAHHHARRAAHRRHEERVRHG